LQIYSFLVKLPADQNILRAIENPSTSYEDIFPIGQPFKSLYAVHAVREYHASQKRKFATTQLQDCEDDTEGLGDSFATALIRALSLVVSALSDPEVIAQSPSRELQIELSSSLVEAFVAILKGNVDGIL
jgi:ubiquitin carboxyl-terminal hydrolase 34